MRVRRVQWHDSACRSISPRLPCTRVVCTCLHPTRNNLQFGLESDTYAFADHNSDSDKSVHHFRLEELEMSVIIEHWICHKDNNTDSQYPKDGADSVVDDGHWAWRFKGHSQIKYIMQNPHLLLYRRVILEWGNNELRYSTVTVRLSASLRSVGALLGALSDRSENQWRLSAVINYYGRYITDTWGSQTWHCHCTVCIDRYRWHPWGCTDIHALVHVHLAR